MRQQKLHLAFCFFGMLTLAGAVVAGTQQAAPAAGCGPASGSLTVVNEKGKSTKFSAEQLLKLPRLTLKAKDHAGNDTTYEGVSLAELLKAADVTLGKQLKGALLANYLLVEAADGYRVVFSLPEVDAVITDNVVLLADRKDGKAFDAKEGPFRLVVPRDKLYMRWVRQVTAISVQAVPGGKKGPKNDQ